MKLTKEEQKELEILEAKDDLDEYESLRLFYLTQLKELPKELEKEHPIRIIEIDEKELEAKLVNFFNVRNEIARKFIKYLKSD
jgi:hypothetical protein